MDFKWKDNMKKVIVISTSLRTNSNSDKLADKFMEGALEAGHEVEKISLIGKDIRFCRGCLACQKLGKCVINDDVDSIMQKVLHADVVVWATPIYYYEMSGQMKVLIDRMNAMYTMDYQFRDVYMLTVAALKMSQKFHHVQKMVLWVGLNVSPKVVWPEHFSVEELQVQVTSVATANLMKLTKWDFIANIASSFRKMIHKK